MKRHACNPGGPMSLALPQKFVDSLDDGEHECGVLEIDASSNQTITSASFTK
jgi:hypothetical protein